MICFGNRNINPHNWRQRCDIILDRVVCRDVHRNICKEKSLGYLTKNASISKTSSFQNQLLVAGRLPRFPSICLLKLSVHPLQRGCIEQPSLVRRRLLDKAATTSLPRPLRVSSFLIPIAGLASESKDELHPIP